MTRIFVELPSFRKEWKAMGLDDDDLRRLQEELLADPKVGKVMRETGGVRKAASRLNRGKKRQRACVFM